MVERSLNLSIMKKITLLLVVTLTVFYTNAQTTLAPGDIAFVGSNTDGGSNFFDSVSFVLLKDIDDATTITFTDRGWNDVTGFTDFEGDGEFTWTSDSARSAGEVVTIDMSLLFPAAYAIIGDQLFAIQGTITTPVFIAGLQYNDATGDDANWDGGSINNSSSALPDQLTNGVNAVRLYGAGSIESDNWQFDCNLASGNTLTGTAVELSAIINNVSNWKNNNTTIFSPTANENCSYNVLPPVDETLVTLVGGILTIEDTIGKNDDLIISYANGAFIITDNSGLDISTTIAGVTGNGTSTITVPNTGITSILVNTLEGDDKFIVDFSEDTINIPINYNGGDQNNSMPGDILTITGGTFATVISNFTNANDGSILLDGSQINYTGLEPIDMSGSTVNDLIFNLPNSANNAVLENDTSTGYTQFYSNNGTFESMVFSNPTNSLTINGGTQAETISVQGVDAAFDADLTINGGVDDYVNFQTNPTNVGTGNITVNALAISVTEDISTTGTGLISMTSDSNIIINSAASVTAENGNITLLANGNTSGDYDGVLIWNGSMVETTGSGNILFTGTAQSLGTNSFNYGVVVEGNAQVITSGTGAITFNGTGASTGENSNNGVQISFGASVTSNGGDIRLNGVAGGLGKENRGVAILENSSVTNAYASGIYINGTGSTTSTGNSNQGIFISSGSTVIQTGTGGISMNGNGGSGINTNIGVFLYGTNTKIQSQSGEISLTGTGGNGTGNNNEGVTITGAAIVESAAGKIELLGTATGGTNLNKGVVVSGAGSGIRNNGGGTLLTGIGAGTGNDNFGIQLEYGGFIESTDSGTITLIGTGSAGVSANQGILLKGAGATISSVNGDISLNGTGGNGTGNNNEGVTIIGDALIQSTGTGAIDITGNATNGISFNKGIVFLNADAITASGGITMLGNGNGTNDSNYGISIEGGSTIEDTTDGNIILTGTGGNGNYNNNGVTINGAGTAVTTINGGITFNGTSGVGALGYNDGIRVETGAVVESTGMGIITMDGI